MKTCNLQIRIPTELRHSSDKVLAGIGMDTSTAVRMFLHQVVFHKGIPFDAKLPESEVRLERVAVDRTTQALMDKVGDALDGALKARKGK